MRRRDLLAAGLAGSFALSFPSAGLAARSRTEWKVRLSEGFDALCFLGALAGGELYMRHYAAEAAAFRPRLPDPVAADISALWKEAADPVGLFYPYLTVLFSSGHDSSISSVIAASARPETLHAAYAGGRHWNAKSWAWFVSIAPRLTTVLEAMREADFAEFRRGLIGPQAEARPRQVAADLAPMT